MTIESVVHKVEEGSPTTLCGNTRAVGYGEALTFKDTLVTCPNCLKVLADHSRPNTGSVPIGTLLPTGSTKQAKQIEALVGEWWEEFLKKSSDYQTSTGNVSESFGLMGQYMKLQDKIHKLRKGMYEAEIVRQAAKITSTEMTVDAGSYNFEGMEEILRDVVGHAFLSLLFLRNSAVDRSKRVG